MQEKKKRGTGVDPMNFAAVVAFGVGSAIGRGFDNWLIGVGATVGLTFLFCGTVALWYKLREGKRKNEEGFEE